MGQLMNMDTILLHGVKSFIMLFKTQIWYFLNACHSFMLWNNAEECCKPNTLDKSTHPYVNTTDIGMGKMSNFMSLSNFQVKWVITAKQIHLLFHIKQIYISFVCQSLRLGSVFHLTISILSEGWQLNDKCPTLLITHRTWKPSLRYPASENKPLPMLHGWG